MDRILCVFVKWDILINLYINIYQYFKDKYINICYYLRKKKHQWKPVGIPVNLCSEVEYIERNPCFGWRPSAVHRAKHPEWATVFFRKAVRPVGSYIIQCITLKNPVYPHRATASVFMESQAKKNSLLTFSRSLHEACIHPVFCQALYKDLAAFVCTWCYNRPLFFIIQFIFHRWQTMFCWSDSWGSKWQMGTLALYGEPFMKLERTTNLQNFWKSHEWS